jgi:hypothetical protein
MGISRRGDALKVIKDGMNVVLKSNGGINKRNIGHDVEMLLSLEDGLPLVVPSPLQLDKVIQEPLTINPNSRCTPTKSTKIWINSSEVIVCKEDTVMNSKFFNGIYMQGGYFYKRCFGFKGGL